jgi:hypothetical protein
MLANIVGMLLHRIGAVVQTDGSLLRSRHRQCRAGQYKSGQQTDQQGESFMENPELTEA